VELLVSPSSPGYLQLALLTGVLLVTAGGMMLLRIRPLQAALAIAVFLALWVVVLQIPTAFLYPRLLRSPWWVRTFEVVAMSGAALMLAGLAGRPARERWITLGRVAFGVSLPVFGVLHLIYGPETATLIPAFYPFPLFLAYFTGSAKIAAGVAIAFGRMTHLAALLTALLYAIYAVTLHIPRQFIGRAPDAQRAGSTSMLVAIAFCGAALIVAGAVQRSARESAAAPPASP
jgi:uncharacterized membrane protein YphA (DoxX/SURF4 family)